MRLPEQPNERIDRARPVRFFFGGRPVEGFEGDTIGSALFASGHRFAFPDLLDKAADSQQAPAMVSWLPTV